MHSKNACKYINYLSTCLLNLFLLVTTNVENETTSTPTPSATTTTDGMMTSSSATTTDGMMTSSSVLFY